MSPMDFRTLLMSRPWIRISWKHATWGPMANVSAITCMALKMPDGPRFCVVTVTFFLTFLSPVHVLSRWIHPRSAIDSVSPATMFRIILRPSVASVAYPLLCSASKYAFVIWRPSGSCVSVCMSLRASCVLAVPGRDWF